MSEATTHHNLAERAATLGDDWSSHVLGNAGNTTLKIFKVSPDGLAPERHADYAEALLMLEGEIILSIDGQDIELCAGDLQIIPAGSVHEIAAGGNGSFLLIDPE